MRIVALLFAILCVVGCGHRTAYYRHDYSDGNTYWMEWKPTTFHGTCAHMYGTGPRHMEGDKVVDGQVWVIEHPYGHETKPDGQVGSPFMDARLFPTQHKAENWAESVCPTR